MATSELSWAVDSRNRAVWSGGGAAQNAGLRMIAMVLYAGSAALLVTILTKPKKGIGISLSRRIRSRKTRATIETP